MTDTLEYVDYSHKGYTLRQFNNWYYQIINADGKTVMCASASRQLTENEAVGIIDNFIKPPKVKVCPRCGKEFETKTNRKYCSEECSHPPKPKLTKICAVCEKEFETTKSNVTLCSEMCKRIKRSERCRASKHKKIEYKNIVCSCCNKEFEPIHRREMYCSDYCRNKAKHKRESETKTAIQPPKKPKRISKKLALCWYCKNACGGCSWSKNLIPIKGWKAKEVTNRGISDSGIKSYKVIECPEFVEGR